MKANFKVVALIITGMAVGYWTKSKVGPDISPKLENYLVLQFGHADISKITDDDAQLKINRIIEDIETGLSNESITW